MSLRTLHTGEVRQRVLARERSHQGLSCESGGGHACRQRLQQAGLHGSDRRGATRRSLSGRKQAALPPRETVGFFWRKILTVGEWVSNSLRVVARRGPEEGADHSQT